MNGLYSILLFLFIFGIFAQGINEMALFDYTIPNSGVKYDNSTVENLQSGSTSTDFNASNFVMLLLAFMRVIGAGLLAMFWVAPIVAGMFTSVGADGTLAAIIATMLQAPLTFVAITGLFEWWTGRSLS